MGYRTRVIASHGPPGRHAMPPLIYRAEAYDEDDRFRDRVWTCSHEHRSVEDAVRCGESWLAGDSDDHAGLVETA